MTIQTAALVFVLALAVAAVGTKLLIPVFHRHQFGQYIREEGPQAHQKKKGTPTMGGIAIILGIIAGLLAGAGRQPDTWAILITMLAFGLIGFLDDYTKIAKKENEGLTPRQKLLLQVLFSIGIAVYMMLTHRTEVLIPFAKVWISLGILYIPFVIFVEVAKSNSVNLTDGLDGLASGVTAVVGLCFAVIGFRTGNLVMTVSGAAIAGALCGFLIYNHYPAKIFMGDTGSMALGGVLSAMAIVSGTEFLLPIAGLIYVLEALSVIIQVLYFRRTGGKRFFRMAPLHHHFELGGMKEYHVVLMFTACTAVLCVIAALGTL
ncbi:MAG: phospho-N-acetylmuramoyl-pentapeptide-transferase [Mogibacterium sp.]|nr:phospho-N-acetylmuramoyl-pentapeptide-transferase [Mogibacterium sp.]